MFGLRDTPPCLTFTENKTVSGTADLGFWSRFLIFAMWVREQRKQAEVWPASVSMLRTRNGPFVLQAEDVTYAMYACFTEVMSFTLGFVGVISTAEPVPSALWVKDCNIHLQYLY